MNLLVLTNCPLEEATGSGYVVSNFCRGLKAAGHQVDLFGPEQYTVLSMLKMGITYRKAIGMFLCAFQQILQKRYDIVEFYGAESWLAAILLSNLPNRTFMLVSHSNGLETHCAQRMMADLGSFRLDGSPPKWHQRLLGSLPEKAFTSVDGLVTVGNFDLDFAAENGYQPKSRLMSIENCLPDQYLNLNVDFQRQPTIGFCGSWLLRKGIRMIVPAMTKILEEFPNSSLKLIGVGSQFEVAEHFPAHALPRIEVVTFASDKENLRQLYQSIAIFIMPSLYESFGMVAAEAMACGCALVSTKVGFAYGLKDQEELIAIEPTATSLYEGVRKLLLNDRLRIQVAQTGYERVQNLRWSPAVDQLTACYQQWLSEFRSKAQSQRG